MGYHRLPEVDQRVRVRALLRFPFSPENRAHTIAELLKDPRTAELAREALGSPDMRPRICAACRAVSLGT